MMRQPAARTDALLVALVGASGVLFGAFGAHALKRVLDPAALAIWHTGVEYHLWHALALALAVAAGHGRARRVAVVALASGIVLFSGSLYALALGAPRWCGLITPFGGLGFLVGWVALGVALAGRRRSS